MVISTPIVLFLNPAFAVPDPNITAPSTISQGGDISTQAALQIPRTFQSTDIVNSIGIYEVTFITSTTGVIDKIEIVFPADTNIGPAGVIERVGIGGGILTKVGTTLTYDVTTPVSIPAGTFIRLEISGIKNPTLPSNTLTATITTKDSGGTTIDGPSATNVYKMRRIGTNDLAVGAVTSQKIADGAITSTKPDDSYEKRVFVDDTPAGHAVGWNPDGIVAFFTITDPAVSGETTAFVSFSLAGTIVTNCEGAVPALGSFSFNCETAPTDGADLHYLVTNLPANVIS